MTKLEIDAVCAYKAVPARSFFGIERPIRAWCTSHDFLLMLGKRICVNGNTIFWYNTNPVPNNDFEQLDLITPERSLRVRFIHGDVNSHTIVESYGTHTSV
jgi:hypothetical protein